MTENRVLGYSLNLDCTSDSRSTLAEKSKLLSKKFDAIKIASCICTPILPSYPIYSDLKEGVFVESFSRARNKKMLVKSRVLVSLILTRALKSTEMKIKYNSKYIYSPHKLVDIRELFVDVLTRGRTIIRRILKKKHCTNWIEIFELKSWIEW